MGSLAGIGVDKLVGYLPIFLGHTHMQGDITRDYAVLEPVRLRWKIIRRNVCIAVAYVTIDALGFIIQYAAYLDPKP